MIRYQPVNPGLERARNQTSLHLGAGPSAIEIITKGEFTTGPDTTQTNTVISRIICAQKKHHRRGDFFWGKQEDSETPEEHWKKLITLKKNFDFKDIKQDL